MDSTVNLDCEKEKVFGNVEFEDVLSLEDYCNDVTIINPKDRNAFLIGVGMTIPDLNLSLESLRKRPWCFGKFLRPSRKLLLTELKRRGAKTKGCLNLTISELIDKINEVTIIVEEDKRYCCEEIQKLKQFIITSSTSPKKEDKRVCITLSDRLRFVHCLFEEEVRSLYEESQAVLSREELDARNSADRKETYEEALTEVFNSKNFIPYSSKLGHLHSAFSTSFPLPLNDLKMSPEKVKDIMMGVKGKLIDLTQRYELSGNGDGQLAENGDSDSDDSNHVIEGSDMKNFLRSSKDIYILYFHHWLSEAGLLEFSMSKLPPGMCASSGFASSTKKAMKKKDEQFEHIKVMENELKRMSGEMVNVTYISLTEKKDEWQERIFELELKVADMNIITQKQQIKLIQNRIDQLHRNVREIEEKLREMDSNKRTKSR